MGDLPFERAVELFGETIRIGAAAGAGTSLIETMSDSYEAKAAVLAAKENCDLPVLVTLIFDEKGKLLTGGTVDSTVAMLEGLRVDALGVNRASPKMHRLSRPDAGQPTADHRQPECRSPRSENGKTVFDIAPAEFSDLMEETQVAAQCALAAAALAAGASALTIEKCCKAPGSDQAAAAR